MGKTKNRGAVMIPSSKSGIRRMILRKINKGQPVPPWMINEYEVAGGNPGDFAPAKSPEVIRDGWRLRGERQALQRRYTAITNDRLTRGLL